MAHPLVDQLRFARRELLRAVDGVSEADGARRFGPMNSIGWIVAHLGWQEQRYWLTRLAGETPQPTLEAVAPNGGPPTTPSLAEMLSAWRAVTSAADPALDDFDEAALARSLPGMPPRGIGSSLHRIIDHYWFHIGEISAVRQLLEDPDRPEFPGNVDAEAPYRPSIG